MTAAWSRREVLRLGGALGAALVAAACGGGGGSGSAAPAGDLAWLRTLSSIEVLLTSAHARAITSGLVPDPNVLAVLALCRDHHTAHAQRLQAATADAGGTAFTESNPVLTESVVDPGFAVLADQVSALSLLSSLETIAAQSYVFAAGRLSTPGLRQAAMAAGAAEARHQTLLADLLGITPVPAALLGTDDRISDRALIPAT